MVSHVFSLDSVTLFFVSVTLSSLSLASARHFVTYRGAAVNLPRHGGKLTAARWQTYRGAAVSDEAACRSDEVRMQE